MQPSTLARSTEQIGVADDSKSVARQVENAKAFASANGYTVTDEHIYVDDAVTALQTQERQRVSLAARLSELSNPAPTMDPAEVRKQLKGSPADWTGLLMGQVAQAQQVLRRLVVGRLTFTPKADGSWEFSGKGTIRPLLGGTIHKLASPTGFEPVFWP